MEGAQGQREEKKEEATEGMKVKRAGCGSALSSFANHCPSCGFISQERAFTIFFHIPEH